MLLEVEIMFQFVLSNEIPIKYHKIPLKTLEWHETELSVKSVKFGFNSYIQIIYSTMFIKLMKKQVQFHLTV